MKKIVIYECEDGKRFENFYSASTYEKKFLSRYKQIRNCFYDVNKIPGDSHAQYHINTVKKKRNEFFDLMVDMIPKCKELIEGYREGRVHPTHIDRLISESGDYPCLRYLFYLFQCFDDKGRLYQQPYYTEHPDKAPNCLNKKPKHNK